MGRFHYRKKKTDSGYKRGRSEVEFENTSERTKRLKTKKLRDHNPTSVLAYATQMSLRSEGHAHASKFLNDMIFTTPKQVTGNTIKN